MSDPAKKMKTMKTVSLLLFVLLSSAGHPAEAGKARCCKSLAGQCKRACEQLAVLQEFPKDKIAEQITDFNNHCSARNVRHIEWCMSSAAQDTEVQWLDAARKCCDVVKSDICTLTCLDRSAGSRAVRKDCQDETEFFTCLQHHQVRDTCCGDKPDAVQCRIACEKFLAYTPSINEHAVDQVIVDLCMSERREERSVDEFAGLPPSCSPNSTAVRATDGHQYLHCCSLASNEKCEEACQDSLRRRFNSDTDAVESLEGRGCGSPSFDDRFWQCFLQSNRDEQMDTSGLASPMSQIVQLGMDGVKLHCCSKATVAGCKKMCQRTFTNEWSSAWNDFNSECLSHIKEDQLIKCMDDVEEPCELGCDGLDYCTVFNNRPTELFRSCSQLSDDAARYDVLQWRQRGSITLFNLELPVKNITKCMPDTWKAVACILQIRPCTRQPQVNKICRDDCLELLSTCLDWASMGPGNSANSLCSRLSPDSGPCVPLKAFTERRTSAQPQQPLLQPMTTAALMEAPITTPCRWNPCPMGTVCLVNRGCRIGNPACNPYQCVPGCKAGEVSHFLVPEDTFARVPTFSGQKGCVKICPCTHKGIEQCHPMPCSQMQSCWLSGKTVEHGTTFKMDCNTCNCYAGEITCTKKSCDMTVEARSRSTGLPCNCVPHRVPVCGSNGNTYPNSCLAKCAGLSDVDLKFGTCLEDDPCAGDHACSRSDEKCVPARQVCLSILKKSCPQYKCVSEKELCEDAAKSPVCDVNGEEHMSLCHLLLRKTDKALAYTGPCLMGCNATGRVCGVDGNTYQSECAAYAASMIVDYPGPCASTGFTGHDGKPSCPEGVVKCPKLPQPGCQGITPPGACCPKCAGAMRILYSQKQVDRVMHALKKPSLKAFSVKSVLMALDRHVQVAECVVRGHLTVQKDLLVLVESTVRRPTWLQLDACVRETEKLAAMIETTSPRIETDLSLSVLITASPVHEPIVNSGVGGAVVASVGTVALAVVVSIMMTMQQ